MWYLPLTSTGLGKHALGLALFCLLGFFFLLHTPAKDRTHLWKSHDALGELEQECWERPSTQQKCQSLTKGLEGILRAASKEWDKAEQELNHAQKAASLTSKQIQDLKAEAAGLREELRAVSKEHNASRKGAEQWDSEVEAVLHNGLMWKNITTVIASFPRPEGINYIRPAVNSLLAGGISGDIHIAFGRNATSGTDPVDILEQEMDGIVNVTVHTMPQHLWDRVKDSPSRGRRVNTNIWCAIKLASPDKYLLLVEDDITMASYGGLRLSVALREVESVLQTEPFILHLSVPFHSASWHDFIGPTVAEYTRPNDFYGSQGMIVSPSCIQLLADYFFTRAVDQDTIPGFQDMIIDRFIFETTPRPARLLALKKSIIQHVGYRSALHDGRFHTIFNYVDLREYEEYYTKEKQR